MKAVYSNSPIFPRHTSRTFSNRLLLPVHRFSRPVRFAFLLIIVQVLVPLLCAAQSGLAAISGTVMDRSGAVISNVDVSLTNADTQSQQETKAGFAGTYSIINIRPGFYSVRASKDGFRTVNKTGIILQVNQTATLDFTLDVGSSNEILTVTSEISQLDSSTAELGTVIPAEPVNDLPLNGRNFTQLLTLTPGVSPISVAQNSGGGGGWAGEALGAFTFPAVNGQRNRSNMFLLDGVNDLAFLGNYNYAPIVDDIQEFKVQSHNDLAEFGQAAGGIVNVATKGGSNTFHGSAWEFFRNEQFDARNYFQVKRNPLRQNQFGVTLGGPVLVPHLYNGKNKTFFFFGYEGFRQSQDTQSVVLAPTTAELDGDFSSLLSQGIQLYNPYTTRPDPANPGEYLRDPFPGNNISGALSPAAVLYAKTLLPIGGTPITGGNLYDTTKALVSQDNFTGRIDQNFRTHDILYGRISHFNQPSSSSAGYPGALSEISINGWNAVVHESHIFGTNRILDLHFGRNLGDDTTIISFTRAPANFADQLINAGFSSKYISTFSSISGSVIPLITIGGYTSTNGSNIQGTQIANTYEFGGDFTQIIGKHTLKLGYSFQTDGFYGPNVGAGEGTTSFQTSNLESPAGTGDALASFLIGVPNSSYRRDDLEQLHGGSVQGAYMQDQFKITPRLSLNMGVRYDVAVWPIYGYFNNGQGYLGDVDLSNGTYILSGVPPACAATVGAPCIPGGSLPADVVVTKNANHSIHDTDTGNWQGRFGLAYRISENTSARAGYSRFYDEWSGLTQISQNLGGTWPSIGSFNINSQNTSTVVNGVGDPLNLGGGAVFYPSASPFTNASFYFNPRMKTPYVDQWNFGVDQKIDRSTTLSVAYVGSHSSRLDNGGLHNTATYPGPGDAAVVASRQPYPYITPTFYDDSTGNSNYNALQARLSRTTFNSLTYLISYTWSKSIDLGCSGGFGVEGCSIQNPYDPRADRSVSGFDLTNIFSGFVVYELPFGQGKPLNPSNRIASSVVSGWQINAIVSLDSGTPYYVTYSGDLANTGNAFVKVDVVGDPTPAHRTPAEWINPSAFAIPAPYTFGTMGRNSLRSDWNRNVDFSVFRTFPIQDALRLEFRAEAFNLTNTAVFGTPNNVINSPNFGTVTSTASTPRELQLALKLYF
jgi:Carboxypeptidase regulatory-like domain/TonB dependent receptor